MLPFRRYRFPHGRYLFHRWVMATAAVGLLSVTAVSGAESVPQTAPTPRAEPAQDQAPEQPADHSNKPSGEAIDLTKLSLEQLLQVDIIPINVLGSHTHLKGEWMIGYRYMRTNQGGHLDGTRSVSHNELLLQYPVAHTKMTMQMHMIEVMYAPSDKLTLMAMVPYQHMAMDHINRAHVRYTTVSDGVGDLALMGLYTLLGDVHKGGNRLLVNAGMSFPTGSIKASDNTPTRRNQRLEYPMQLGSGTFDLMPGITYLGETRSWAWGAQTLVTLRLGRNDIGYRFGNEYQMNGWGVYKVNDWLAPSLRISSRGWGNVRGTDPVTDPNNNPAYDPRRQKGRRVDLFVGLNLYVPKGRLKGNRLTLEAGWPIFQSLKGPQLKTNQQWILAWSYTLGR